MKKILFTLLPCCAMLCSCVEKNTEALFTEATLTAVLPDSLQMVRFQATAGFTNANTRRSGSSSDFRDGVLAIRLQKGIYSIKIGSGSTVEYIVKSTGESHMRQVTADARAALLRDAESVSVDLLWYENAVSGSAGADR